MSQCFFESHYMGDCTYNEGLHHQEQALENLHSTGHGLVLGFNHPSTVTLGKRGHHDNDIKSLKGDTQVVEVDRGGEATLHSPGQLVIYPVIPLKQWGIGVREFVQLLENTSLRFFEQFAIRGTTKYNEPGLYTDRGKIAFFGLRIQEGVATHGLAINVFNDLSLFEQIRSCGRDNESFDRMIDYGVNAPLKVLFSLWSQCFRSSFSLTHKSREISLSHL